MRDEYDFAQSVPNPYLKNLKLRVNLQVEEDVVVYFQQMAEETGIPYQRLMALYLRDCMKSGHTLSLE